jgi:hypothetical protein
MASKKKAIEPTTETGEIVVDIFAPPAPPVSASTVTATEARIQVIPVEHRRWSDNPWALRIGLVITGVLIVVAIIGLVL